MKKIIFLLFFASLAHANGPQYGPNYTQQNTDLEFQNAYHDIRNPGAIKVSTITFSDSTTMITAATGSTAIVLQSTGCTTTSAKSVSTSTFSQTNCSCTIKPTSASSRIVISATGELDNAATGITGLTIMRGSTNNLTGSAGLVQIAGSGLAGAQMLASMTVVDNNYLSTNTTTYYVGMDNTLGDTPNFGGSSSRTQQMWIVEFKNP